MVEEGGEAEASLGLGAFKKESSSVTGISVSMEEVGGLKHGELSLVGKRHRSETGLEWPCVCSSVHGLCSFGNFLV